MFNNEPTHSRRSFLQSVFFAGLGYKVSGANLLVDLKERLSLVKTIAIHEESTEGGEILCFFNDKEQIKKLEITQCWESGRYFLRILTSDDRIISAEEIVERYNVPFYITKHLAEEIGSEEFFDESKSTIKRNRFIFKKNKIHRSLDKPISEYESGTLESLESECAKRIQQALKCLART